MIDTEAIEIVFQLAETLLPPREIIILHRIPIIGREPPVLTVHGEIVRRGTGLAVHIEIFRFHPRFDTRTVHPNRQIAFQYDPVFAGIIGNTFELGMQNILKEIQERYFRIRLTRHGTKFTNTVLVEYGIFLPLCKIGSPVRVTQITIGGIGHQPRLVLCEELLIFRGGQDRFPFLLEVFPAIFYLIPDSLFIIYGIQSIQFGLLPSEKSHLFRICQPRCTAVRLDAQIGQTDIHRMKSINRNGAIRIRISTGMRRRRVVHREHLDDALVRFLGPIHQHAQITQIADSKALFRA